MLVHRVVGKLSTPFDLSLPLAEQPRAVPEKTIHLDVEYPADLKQTSITAVIMSRVNLDIQLDLAQVNIRELSAMIRRAEASEGTGEETNSINVPAQVVFSALLSAQAFNMLLQAVQQVHSDLREQAGQE